MKHNFKSLIQSNVVLVMNPSITTPENKEFAGLYGGEEGQGTRFIDDPIIQTKMLNIPKLQLKVTLEGPRLRIDDESKLGPDETRVVPEAVKIYNKLFPKGGVQAIGFNFDFIYRFPEVIPADYIFKQFINEQVLKKAKLKDLGVQFATERENGKIQEVYFFKIPSPLELAVHYNWHTFVKELPKVEKLQQLYAQAHIGADVMVENLKFS